MDLCLIGSHINLVTRQKPKPKFASSYTNLSKSHRVHPRPHSANFIDRRSQSSPFLRRPQSADPKFGRNFESPCGSFSTNTESDISNLNLSKKQQKKFQQSVSSSNLLKLLLDEPIKRSWLCKGSPNTTHSDGDASSELNSYRRAGSYTNLKSGSNYHKPLVNNDKFMSTVRDPSRKISPATASSMLHSSKGKPTNVSYSSHYSSTNTVSSTIKPDLPGRVSFSKPQQNSNSDNDSSDYDSPPFNYEAPVKQQESISAPGPVNPEDYSFKPKTATPTPAAAVTKELSSLSLKKTVHFGSNVNGEEIISETFEYPKCPSENCSCSTRSSSSGSLQESLSPKCYCNATTCKYITASSNSKQESESSTPQIDVTNSSEMDKHHMNLSHTQEESQVIRDYKILTRDLQEHEDPPMTRDYKKVTVPKDPRNSEDSHILRDFKNASQKLARDLKEPEESQVIRDYKNAVGEQLENSVVKNLLDDGKPKGHLHNLNNFELPSYLSKYSHPLQPTPESLENPNNIAEKNNALNAYKSEGAKKDLLKMDNKLDGSEKPKTSSDSVINNYLKVAASTSSIIRKKETNKNSECEPKRSLPLSLSQNAKTKAKAAVAPLTQNNIKKAKSFGSLREDTTLHEFNMDKIDTWMSMQEESQAKSKTSLTKHASLDDSFEKLTRETLEAMSAMDADAEGDDEDDDRNSAKSMDQSQDDSTYEEIVSVIKEIEEDKKKDNYAERMSSEMDLKLSTTPSVGTPHHQPTAYVDLPKSPDKYRDILSYLDNVEDSCDKTLLETRRSMPDTNRTEVEFIVEPDIAEDVPKLSDLLMLPNHQLARRVIALSLRANELANAVHLSKEHVIKIRSEKQKSLRSEKVNASNRMKEQKKHYETIVKRHQGFIEQLLKDKGSLCEKVAALTRRLESQNQAWEHKLETEVARVKDTTLAGEKIRRERWVRENTKKIKELTVKGLEAEINKMTCNHQKEITELKRAHQQQLLDALEDARIKHEQIENNIRESCAQDRESIISKERNAIRERFERQLEEERNSFDEQKQKLTEELNSEKERFQHELKVKDFDLQNKRIEWQREKEIELEQTISELQEKMSKQEEKFLNRINNIGKQYEADFELWKREFENSCKVQQVEKENSIRQHYRAERDRQIDAIVQRMDAEALKNTEEHETKLNRLKEKYDKDLQELEAVEKSVREKYADTRNKLAESDAQVRNFQAEIKQLQIELDHTKKMCSDIHMERDQLRENQRNEIQTEVQSLKLERDQEIQQIHKRVQQAIEKKDATIDILQKENGSLRERCLKLEAVIRQQRKDYCVK